MSGKEKHFPSVTDLFSVTRTHKIRCMDSMATIGASIPLQPHWGKQEWTEFNFFRFQVAPRMSGATGLNCEMDTWSQWLPQAAVFEPSVRHAICALGSLLRSLMVGEESGRQEALLFAHQQYSRAIQCTVTGIQEGRTSVDLSIVFCILLALFEKLLGNINAAVIHLRAGLNLLESADCHRRRWSLNSQSRYSENPTVHVLLRRLQGQLLLVGQTCLRYDEGPSIFATPSVPSKLGSLGEASTALENLLNTVLLAYHVPERSVVQTCATQKAPYPPLASCYIPAFKKWTTLFHSLLHEMGPEAAAINGDNQSVILTIRTSQTAIRIFLYRVDSAGEMGFDAFHDEFATIVRYCTIILRAQQEPWRYNPARISDANRLEFDTVDHRPSRRDRSSDGVTPQAAIELDSDSKDASPSGGGTAGSRHMPMLTLTPLSPIGALYITAHHCRDPRIRRSAIQLMRGCNWNDGMWNSHTTADFAERIVQIEETGWLAGPIKPTNKQCIVTAGQIPAEHRCDRTILRLQDDQTVVVDFINFSNYVHLSEQNDRLGANITSIHRAGLIRESWIMTAG